MAKHPRKPVRHSPVKAPRPAGRRVPAHPRRPSQDPPVRNKAKGSKPMTDKDHDKREKEAADKRDAEKREKEAADKREHDKREGHIDNRDQDPNDPANKTLPKDVRPAAERDHIEGAVYSSENQMTTQERDAQGESLGIGPLSRSENSPGPVETMEDLGIGPRTPYPFGDPPPPSESVTYGQGIKGVTDKPSAKPGSASGPAGTAPGVDDKDAAYRADHKKEPAHRGTGL